LRPPRLVDLLLERLHPGRIRLQCIVEMFAQGVSRRRTGQLQTGVFNPPALNDPPQPVGAEHSE
jgi:hypothetical protein